MLVRVREGYTLCVGPKMIPPGTELEISNEVYVSQSWKCIRLETPAAPVEEPPVAEEASLEKETEKSEEDIKEKQITKAKNRAMTKARTRAVG